MSEDTVDRDTVSAFVGAGSGEGGQEETGEQGLLSDARGGASKGGTLRKTITQHQRGTQILNHYRKDGRKNLMKHVM